MSDKEDFVAMAEPVDKTDKAISADKMDGTSRAALSLQELKDKLRDLEDKMKTKTKKHSEAVLKYYKSRAEKDEVFREKERARHRKKYEANKESSIQRLKVWRVENPVKVKEYNRIHAQKLKERLAADPEFRKEHLEKSRVAREKFKAKRQAELEEIKRKIAEATQTNDV